jgi:hypothetical protein
MESPGSFSSLMFDAPMLLSFAEGFLLASIDSNGVSRKKQAATEIFTIFGYSV